MLRSIADVCVFLTPFEDGALATEKIRKSREMFDAYALGCGLGLWVSRFENGRYLTRRYADASELVELRFSYREDLPPADRFPSVFANFSLSSVNFPQDAVEAFVNDGIGFLTGVFGTECFVDVDPAYRISSAKSGKKPDISSLETFDLSNPRSKKNKDVLDTLGYLRFSLIRNALGIESNAKDVGELLAQAPSWTGLFENLELFRQRSWMTHEDLIDQARKIDLRMTQFLTLIS